MGVENLANGEPAGSSDPGRGAVALSASPARFQTDVSQWFCIQTKPAHEAQAIASLTRLPAEIQENVGALEIYFPQVRTRMTVAGHSRPVVRPLFPRYFFTRFIWEKAVRFIASRPQVLGVVQFGEFPSVVPALVIEELRLWSVEPGSELFDPTASLKPGQQVVIQNGPFKGMEAEFILHLSDQKRVALLMNHLQSRARLVIHRADIKPMP